MTSSCASSSSSNYFPARCFFWWRNKWKSLENHKQQQFVCEFPLDVHLLRWEIVWRNAPRIWRDFGSALPFQTSLTQTKPVLPLSNEHGSQVKDQGRWKCSHNKHKKFPYRPTSDKSLLSGHASYIFHSFNLVQVFSLTLIKGPSNSRRRNPVKISWHNIWVLLSILSPLSHYRWCLRKRNYVHASQSLLTFPA